MTEDQISREMYKAARHSSSSSVLSWQGVGGKSYFNYDLRIDTPSETMAPDLVVVRDGFVWILEIKGTHRESLEEDEPKLARLASALTPAQILDTVARVCRVDRRGIAGLRYGVAFSHGSASPACQDWVAHLPWESKRPDLDRALDELSQPQ